jgi:uncharacterized repeat protein (TIGR01451 family)
MKKPDAHSPVPSKRPSLRPGSVFGLALVLGFLFALPAARGAEPEAAGPKVGVPSPGVRGINETVDEIMARQRIADLKPPKPQRLMPEHELPLRKVAQDPASPQVAQWPPPSDQARRADVGRNTPQTLGTSFTGATLADTGAFPPDSMGAAGPTQFVVFVNGRIRTFNKTTGVADGVMNADPDVFFSSVMTPEAPPGLNFTSDPQVRYDRLSGRWFLTIIDVPSSSAANIGDTPNRLLIAVSDAASSAALSGSTVWTFYFVQQNTIGGGDSGEFLDYPSLGVDVSALYVGGNMFNAAAGTFVNFNAYVIRKSSALSGGPLVTTAFRGLVGTDGPDIPRGVDNYDPAAAEGYIIGPSDAAFGRLIMRRISDPGGTPAISANVAITVPATSFPITVDHLGNTGGTNGNLDAIDDRLFVAHIRNGRLWTAHSNAVTAAGVSSNSDAQRRDGVRWYELNVPAGAGTPTVVQSGTIFDSAATVAAARQYWMGSVMVSGQGHAALGFSTAGTPFRADAATVGRLSGDTVGTTQTVSRYTASATAYNPPGDPGPTRRWGDYSFTSLDPKDDMTMWTIQEFCDVTNSYGVRVVKLIAPPPATPSSASSLPVTIPPGTSVFAVTGTSSSGSGYFDPGANPPAGPAFNHIQASLAPSVAELTVNSVTYLTPTSLMVSITNSGAPAGNHDLTITNPDGQSATTANFFTVAVAGTPDLTVTKSHVGNFFQGQTGAQYTITVTNSGTASSSGTVALTDALPVVLTPVSISGGGWGCTQPSGPCTRSDALAAGNSYPVLTLTVNVATLSPPSVTNSVTVSGGGESNTANDTANDPTTILPAGSFFTVAPCRLLDTRSSSPLGAGATMTVVLTGGACGIPVVAAAVSMNVTVTGAGATGYLLLYAANQAPPSTNNLSFNAGQTRANNAIVGLVTDGSGMIKIRNNSSAPLDVLIDVNGFFE